MAIIRKWFRLSEAVSYTHLDVYKRQGMENTFMIIKKKNIRTIVITCALLGIIIFSIHSYNVYMSRQISVSYTHLVKES